MGVGIVEWLAPLRDGRGGEFVDVETRDAMGIRVGFASVRRGEREGVVGVLGVPFPGFPVRADPFI